MLKSRLGRHARGSGVEAYKPHEILSACGRIRDSLSQHRCINLHTPSVKVGWAGRGGRSPLMTANLAAGGGLSLNGAVLAKAFVRMTMLCHFAALSAGYLQRTSIATPANEKMSASLLYVPPSKISGAIHLALRSSSVKTLRIEPRSWVTMARPKSVIRARAIASTRMFDWLGMNMLVNEI